MINRAKCKLCNKIIEIENNIGWISCACGEISITMRNGNKTAMVKHEGNLMEVDDQGNEIILDYVDHPDNVEKKELKKSDLIALLDKMIKDCESLPPQAMSTYVSQYELMSLLMLLSSLFKSKD